MILEIIIIATVAIALCISVAVLAALLIKIAIDFWRNKDGK